MPEFRYDGPSDIFHKAEGDDGVVKGATGSFSQAMVDRYKEQGHLFTPVSDLKAKEVEAAKTVAKEASSATTADVGQGAGTVSR